jgi:hypothetical protein
MFSELKCNTELEHRSSGCRRVCKCRRHNFRFDEYGYDRRAGSDRRSNNKGMISGSSRPCNLIEIS